MIVEQKEISKAVISRLPRYYSYLGELMEELSLIHISGKRIDNRKIFV